MLLDDDPYKVQVNPEHTAIHPRPWQCTQTRDTSLCLRNGDIAKYLQLLLDAPDAQAFIRSNPYAPGWVPPAEPEVEVPAAAVVSQAAASVPAAHEPRRAAAAQQQDDEQA